MKKFIQKIAAMAVSGIICITSAMPAIAATTEDYVPTIDLNYGISLAEEVTGSSETYTTSGNGMTITAVDDSYNVLQSYDTSSLTVGNMGGVKTTSSRTFDGVTYNFSHYEYATSVRNYVASYNTDFQFYVDPPITILAVYTTGTPNPPSGPVVGMYRDPEVVDDKTFYYLSEAASQGTDLSNVKANITFGRSSTDQSVTGNEETFSTQAKNIYSSTNTNNIQFIVASAITSGGPINFTATANATAANAQIKMWNFGTAAFDNVTAGTAQNGITLSDASDTTDTSLTAGDGKVFTKGFNATATFTVNTGDVVRVYNDGTSVSASNGTITSTGTNFTTITASSTGNMSVSGGYIYAVSINLYTSVGGGTDVTTGGGSTEEAFSYTFLQDNQTECTSWLDVSSGTSTSFGTGSSHTGYFSDLIFDEGTTGAVKGQTGISFSSKTAFTVTTTGDNQTLTLYMLRNDSGTSTVTITSTGSEETYSITNGSTTTTSSSFTVQNRSATNQEPFVITLPSAGTYTFTAGSNNTMLFKAVLSGTTSSGSGSTTVQNGSIYGIVTDASTNNAIYGATVTLSTGASATTDISGYYEFSGLDVDKSYTVTASMTGYASNSATTASLTTSGIKQDIALSAEAEEQTSGTISGTVTNSSTSEAIEGVLVKLFIGDDEQSSSTQTDANGSYSLTNILFGYDYILKFSASGFDDNTLTVSGFNADKTDADVSLTPTTTTGGGETTWWYMQNKQSDYGTGQISASTTIDYGYTLKYYTGTSTSDKFVSLSSKNLTVNGVGINYGLYIGGESSNVPRRYFEVTLSEGDIFKLYIYGNNGSSSTQSNTYICTSTSYIGDTTNSTLLATAATGDQGDGSYDVTADGTYYIWGDASKPYFLAMSKKSGTATTGTISAAVKDQNGNAVSGATVSCNGISAETDSSGVAELKKITAGTYTVTAEYNGDTGSADSVVVEVGSTASIEITINITTGTIQVNLQTSSGSSLTGAVVTAYNSENTYTLDETSAGVYVKTGAAAGTYTISASYGGITGTASVTVESLSTASATITLNADSVIEIERQTKIDTLITTLLAEEDPSDGSLWNSETSTEYKWSYINGCMITAFMDLYEVTGDSKYYDVSDAYQSGFVNDNGTVAGTRTTAVASSYDLDDVNPGKSLLDLISAGSSNSAKYELCVTEQLSAILNRCSRIEKGTLNFYHKANYPHQVWLDGTYMALPYMIQYENVIDENAEITSVADDVTAQFENVYNKMRNTTTGLYYHGYDAQADSSSLDYNLTYSMSWARSASDEAAAGVYKVSDVTSTADNDACSSSYWLRAMGWYGMALIDTYEQMTLAEDASKTSLDTQKTKIAGYFTELMKAILNYQDSTTGMWYQVVDYQDKADEENAEYNYLETSGSAAFAACLMKGYNLGLLDESYYEAGLKAFNGITDNYLVINSDSTAGLTNICGTAGLGGVTTSGSATGHTSSSATRGPKYNYRDGSFDYYVSEKLATNDAKGAAPYLMAYAQKLLHDEDSNS